MNNMQLVRPRVTRLGEDVTHQFYPQRRDRVGRFTVKSWIYGKWCRFVAWCKWLLKVGIVIAIFVGVSMALGKYAFSSNTITYSTKEVPVQVMVDPPIPPILAKIAQAESHSSQFCTADLVKSNMCRSSEVGAPLVRPVLKGDYAGTYDIGKYQINSMHLAAAVKLGLNVYTETDNEKFALYLFNTQGSEPWAPSKKGWK